MVKRRGFTLIELLVVISIIALLLAILMPALGAVKERARALVCLTNVRTFAIAQVTYSAANDDKVVSLYFVDEGKFWDEKLEEYYQVDDVRLCPSAKKLPSADSEFDHGSLGMANYGTPYEAWYHRRNSGDNAGRVFAGSYGTNAWIHQGYGQTWAFAPENHWGKMSVKNSASIPLMLDCTWVSGYPLDTDQPISAAANDDYRASVWGRGEGVQMARYAFSRHPSGTGVSFMDGSARNVPHRELWELKWHRAFKSRSDVIIEW